MIISKEYTLKSDKLTKRYYAIGIADTHFGKIINSRLITELKEFILKSEKKIDFILVSGDIMNAKYYLNDKVFNLVKSIFDDLSLLSKAPVLMSLGNHDLDFCNSKNYEMIIKRFMNLKNNSNLIPLNDNDFKYDDFDIFGTTLPKESYLSKNLFGENGIILNDKLKKVITNKKLYNINLVHDPLSVYYSYLSNNENINKFDLFFSGHLHGGYLRKKTLMNNNVKYGYVEYFRNFKTFVKVPFVSGKHTLSNTELIVNEGLRRYNALISSNIYTTPFISAIDFVPKRKALI